MTDRIVSVGDDLTIPAGVIVPVDRVDGLGTAATADADDFATSAQGAKADAADTALAGRLSEASLSSTYGTLATDVDGTPLVKTTGTQVRVLTPEAAGATYALPPVLAGNDRVGEPTFLVAAQRQCAGFDSNGRAYWYSSSTFERSAPNSTTPTNGLSSIAFPGVLTASRVKVIQHGAYLYLQCGTSSNGSTPPAIYRSDPTTISWAKVHDFGTHADTIGTGLSHDASYIYAAEYSSAAQGETPASNGPDAGTKIYRSADGTTWTTVLTLPTLSGGGVRHCHAVEPDPYNPGHVYATFGDANSCTKVMRSTDYGANWAEIVDGPTMSSFQAVQISFSPKYVWFAGDNVSLAGLPVYVMDRTELVPKWACMNRPNSIAVPSGLPARKITDASFTSGSTQVTSATAAFTAADVGRFIYGNQQFKDGTYIAAVTNSTTVQMSTTSGNTIASQSLVIGGDEFYAAACYGSVDPASERFYCVAMDPGQGGTVAGLFMLDKPGGTLRLLRRLHFGADNPMYIRGGYLYFAMYRVPLAA